MSASAQIPNAPGTPIGTPLGSPGAVDAVRPVPPQPLRSTTGEAEDPPGRVGRISELTGQVWLYNPDSGDWVGAERNRPLTTGDRLATDGGARAEVQIGSTTLRLDGGSEVEVLRLDDDRTALQLHSGSLAARLRSAEAARQFELTTGEGRFTAQRAGRYRFDRADEASHVTVYSGQALYEGVSSALTVNANQRAEFWIDDKNAAQYSITDPARDAFAGWNSEQDRADDRSAATRYVSPEMTGVEDLDRYGRWEQNPEYGALWIPRTVATGWAPYSTGRWAWVQPWGWTWVDDAPWGFAPFHYGRWVNVRSVWCWSPGQYVRRPVYAPALVAWIGGPRLSVSINIGGGPAVGWVPLAPREVYVPGYRVSPRYVRNVNVTHVTNITNITTIVNNPQAAVGQQTFANRKFPHAVTVVPAHVIESRQPVTAEARRWRDSPDARRFINEPARVAAIAAPPVAAPTAPLRRAEPNPGGGASPREGRAIALPPNRAHSPNFTQPDAAGAARPAMPIARPAPTVVPPPQGRANVRERPAAPPPREAAPGRADPPAAAPPRRALPERGPGRDGRDPGEPRRGMERSGADDAAQRMRQARQGQEEQQAQRRAQQAAQQAQQQQAAQQARQAQQQEAQQARQARQQAAQQQAAQQARQAAQQAQQESAQQARQALPAVGSSAG